MGFLAVASNAALVTTLAGRAGVCFGYFFPVKTGGSCHRPAFQIDFIDCPKIDSRQRKILAISGYNTREIQGINRDQNVNLSRQEALTFEG